DPRCESSIRPARFPWIERGERRLANCCSGEAPLHVAFRIRYSLPTSGSSRLRNTIEAIGARRCSGGPAFWTCVLQGYLDLCSYGSPSRRRRNVPPVGFGVWIDAESVTLAVFGTVLPIPPYCEQASPA